MTTQGCSFLGLPCTAAIFAINVIRFLEPNGKLSHLGGVEYLVRLRWGKELETGRYLENHGLERPAQTDYELGVDH